MTVTEQGKRARATLAFMSQVDSEQKNKALNAIANMLEKTGFRSRTELAVRARESGLTILDRTEDDV